MIPRLLFCHEKFLNKYLENILRWSEFRRMFFSTSDLSAKYLSLFDYSIRDADWSHVMPQDWDIYALYDQYLCDFAAQRLRLKCILEVSCEVSMLQ